MENKLIYYFTANWCSPCKMLAPIMESLSDQINYVKVDVDQEPLLAMEYGVKSIPTLVLTINEIEVKKMSGLKSKQEILNFYNNA